MGAAVAAVLALGVAEQRSVIDEWLVTYSQGWSLDRMPAVDRTLARLGAWEIVFAPDVPDQVVIGDLADLAGSLSTDSSANFLSGLLGRLSKLRDSL
jgi:N utilization substance protein B